MTELTPGAGGMTAPLASRARVPSKTAFAKACAMVRDAGLDDRGFRLSPDGTLTILPATVAEPSDAYERWKAKRG